MKKIIMVILRSLLLIWICVLILCLILVKNPFYARTIDAQAEDPVDLESIYDDRFPYVHIRHMDLVYTGYYSLSDDEAQITAYCFVGHIGDHGYLVELSAEDVYGLTDDVTSGISDADIMGMLVYDSDLMNLAAADGGMTIMEYAAAYDICRFSIYQYHSDMERIRIYYLLALTGAGILAATIYMKKSSDSRKAATCTEQESKVK